MPLLINLTPLTSIEALEKRFQLGEETKGTERWNALRNQEQLDNKEWVSKRIEHGMQHLIHYQAVRAGFQEDDGDDDGAAIMWLGCMLHEAYMRRKTKAGANGANS